MGEKLLHPPKELKVWRPWSLGQTLPQTSRSGEELAERSRRSVLVVTQVNRLQGVDSIDEGGNILRSTAQLKPTTDELYNTTEPLGSSAQP
jgi:hypothetical protein